ARRNSSRPDTAGRLSRRFVRECDTAYQLPPDFDDAAQRLSDAQRIGPSRNPLIPSRALLYTLAISYPQLAVAEPSATGILLLVLGVLMAISVLFSRGAERQPTPRQS